MSFDQPLETLRGDWHQCIGPVVIQIGDHWFLEDRSDG